MRVHNVTYLLGEGIKNIFFNKLMSLACIGVLVACLLLIGGALLVTLNVNAGVEIVEEQNEVKVFLEDNLDNTDIEVLDLTLASMENILQSRFVSKEEGLVQLRNKMGEFGDLLNGLDETNPLPPSFVVRIDDLSLMDETVEELVNIRGVYKVSAPTEVAAVLTGLKRSVGFAGAAVVGILIIVSIVIITNTIKLTVFSRRREINIMKYVGATDGFIRLPFIVEGMFIGLIAAIFAFLALGFGYTYFLQWASKNYGNLLGVWLDNAVIFKEIALTLFAGFAAMGVFIGVVSSGIFVRKYLRV